MSNLERGRIEFRDPTQAAFAGLPDHAQPSNEVSERTTLAIPREMFDALAEIARRNERSASAEARLAIRAWITANATSRTA